MVSDSKTQDNKKLCAFQNDFGHLMIKCCHQKWKIESLINIYIYIYSKEFIPSKKTQKEGDQRTSTRKRTEGNKNYNGEVPVIHLGFASGGDIMATQKDHIKKGEVIPIEVTDKKNPKLLFQFPDIVFTEKDSSQRKM